MERPGGFGIIIPIMLKVSRTPAAEVSGGPLAQRCASIAARAAPVPEALASLLMAPDMNAVMASGGTSALSLEMFAASSAAVGSRAW